MLVPDRRQHDAVELLVVEVTHLEQHVSVDGVRDPGRHELDEIAIVDRAVDPVLVERRERHDRHGLTALRQAVVRGARDRDRDRGGIVGFERGLQEAVRCQHHVEPAKVRMGNALDVAPRLRDGSNALHVPGMLAAQKFHDALIARERRAAAASRIAASPAHEILARRARVVVDRACVLDDLESRPIAVEHVALTDLGPYHPVPEISIESTSPIARTAARSAPRASCADAAQAPKADSASTGRAFLIIGLSPLLWSSESCERSRGRSVRGIVTRTHLKIPHGGALPFTGATGGRCRQAAIPSGVI